MRRVFQTVWEYPHIKIMLELLVCSLVFMAIGIVQSQNARALLFWLYISSLTLFIGWIIIPYAKQRVQFWLALVLVILGGVLYFFAPLWLFDVFLYGFFLTSCVGIFLFFRRFIRFLSEKEF